MPVDVLMPFAPVSPSAAPVLLDDVTLVAVTCVALPATVLALTKSMAQARFGRVLLLSDSRPHALDLPGGRDIEWRQIAAIRSRGTYSRFMLDHLAPHIETSFALIVQWDGYVIDGGAWRGEFLDYDYIGAPWPHFDNGWTVGNGGFSLRSKRLLEACRNLPLRDGEAEDVAICRTARPRLEREHGVRFASEAVARCFAYERTPKQGHEFGFHGVFNMIQDMPRADFTAVLASLEPRLLARRESGEILRIALRAGHLPTVAQALRQKFAARPSGKSTTSQA